MPKIKTALVRTLMERQGITQEKLAREMDMSLATVKRILSGRGDPRETTALEMARALNVAPEAIMVYGEYATPREALLKVWYLVNAYRDAWSEEQRRKVAARLLKGGGGK